MAASCSFFDAQPLGEPRMPTQDACALCTKQLPRDSDVFMDISELTQHEQQFVKPKFRTKMRVGDGSRIYILLYHLNKQNTEFWNDNGRGHKTFRKIKGVYNLCQVEDLLSVSCFIATPCFMYGCFFFSKRLCMDV